MYRGELQIEIESMSEWKEMNQDRQQYLNTPLTWPESTMTLTDADWKRKKFFVINTQHVNNNKEKIAFYNIAHLHSIHIWTINKRKKKFLEQISHWYIHDVESKKMTKTNSECGSQKADSDKGPDINLKYGPDVNTFTAFCGFVFNLKLHATYNGFREYCINILRLTSIKPEHFVYNANSLKL